ncbi:MAG: carboxypeptidase-like regulatory domain-containing protein [Bacteroidota bacterium]
MKPTILTPILGAVLLSFSQLIHAQVATIEGYIYDADTKEPIIGANVFLNNSTIGAATDIDGFYKIPRVPLGEFELVVTYISHKSKSLLVNISQRTAYKADFIIEPDLKQLDAVTVRGSNAQWKRSLGFFKKYFLGTSYYSNKCKLRNPEVLDFDFDDETLVTSATANGELIIDNEALGYTIYYSLEQFEWDNTDCRVMEGKTRFEPKEAPDRKRAYQWQRNRKRAFNGSIQQFFMTLARDTLPAEGFTAYRLQNIPDAFSRGEEPRYGLKLDTLLVYDSVNHNFNFSFNDYLEVVYENEPQPSAYQKFKEQRIKSDLRTPEGFERLPQVSILELKSDEIRFDATGYVYNPTDYIVYGYWAWERMADLVPIDYDPEEPAL